MVLLLLLLLMHIQFHTQYGIYIYVVQYSLYHAVQCIYSIHSTHSVCLPMVHFCVILVPSLSCPHLFLTISISFALIRYGCFPPSTFKCMYTRARALTLFRSKRRKNTNITATAAEAPPTTTKRTNLIK